ncbi:hypothetical protein [Helicobacter sp. MIT 14-3879]|uniref:hypothetical protein n=1 Tax=Helicobacter sp. MIT 14-3879 TaxID=2040649 RepID=UPI0021630F5F|nr:hypothetical protein [Helicobacter sp. MIT 14-3879]
MLQNARKAESRSFLRELEFSLVLIQNINAREYFLKNLSEVNVKRNDPNITKTGERDIKSELLAYLSQRGYTQTANIWARALSMDRKAINKLLEILQVRLLKEGIEGILEIHLQDREINSPHIQFVGLQADKAESIIAHTLVELQYETSVENALSKKEFRPYYKINPKARYPKHSDLQENIEYYKAKKEQESSKEELDKFISEFYNELRNLKGRLKKLREKKIEQVPLSITFESFNQNNSQFLQKLREKRRVYRIRRLKRRKRK